MQSSLSVEQRAELVLSALKSVEPLEAAAKLALFRERYNEARPHWALKAAAPMTTGAHPGARVLTPREGYVKGQKVNPPSWSRWVGWLERPETNQTVNGQDQAFNQAEQAPSKTAELVSALKLGAGHDQLRESTAQHIGYWSLGFGHFQ